MITRTRATVENPAADQEREPEPPFGGDRQRDEHAARAAARGRTRRRTPCRSARAPRPVLGRGHVGHIRLRDEDVAARGAVEHPGQEHVVKSLREPEDQERDGRAAWLAMSTGRRP